VRDARETEAESQQRNPEDQRSSVRPDRPAEFPAAFREFEAALAGIDQDKRLSTFGASSRREAGEVVVTIRADVQRALRDGRVAFRFECRELPFRLGRRAGRPLELNAQIRKFPRIGRRLAHGRDLVCYDLASSRPTSQVSAPIVRITGPHRQSLRAVITLISAIVGAMIAATAPIRTITFVKRSSVCTGRGHMTSNRKGLQKPEMIRKAPIRIAVKSRSSAVTIFGDAFLRSRRSSSRRR
jgi:hypothetical protein